VFFQADTVKGYRFWDETGLIANKYADRFQIINYGNVQGTLTCAAPRDHGDHLTELRISPYNIWLAYGPRVSWVTVRQETAKEVDWIARAIGVTQFSRLGLRTSLLWPGDDQDQITDLLITRILHTEEKHWSTLGNVTGGNFILFFTSSRLAGRLEISPVMNVRREERVTLPGQDVTLPPAGVEPLPDFALNVDIDLADTRPGDSVDVKPHLNRSVEYIESVLTPFITRLLEDNS